MPFVNAAIGPNGPVVTVYVTVTPAHEQALVAANLPVPPPVAVSLLVDTGASATNVCATVIPAAGLMQTGMVSVHTPSTAGQPVQMPQYDARLLIPLAAGGFHVINAMPVTCPSFAATGIQGLLGRDVLSKCVMSYHGDLALCTLAF